MSDSIRNTVSEKKALNPISRRRTRAASPGVEQVYYERSEDESIDSGMQGRAGPGRSDFVDIEQLPRDVGWLLFGVGFAGVVAPGVFGLPFMIGGGMILWPRTSQRLFDLLAGGSPKTMNAGIKQVYRFLDDLEKRYPRG